MGGQSGRNVGRVVVRRFGSVNIPDYRSFVRTAFPCIPSDDDYCPPQDATVEALHLDSFQLLESLCRLEDAYTIDLDDFTAPIAESTLGMLYTLAVSKIVDNQF